MSDPKYIDPGNNFFNKTNTYQFLRFSEVIFVDYFRRTCDIRYLDSHNFATSVSFVMPMQGLNSLMNAMPTKGSIALVGYFRDATELGYPVILGFLPRNSYFAYSFEATTLRPDITDEAAQAQIQERMKYWKTYPGEILLSSQQGSDLRIDKSIFIQNAMLNEIYLDQASQVMSFLSLNQTFSSKAGRFNFGLIHRNELLNSNEFRDDYLPSSQPLSDGRFFYRVTNAPKDSKGLPNQSLSDAGILGYTEFRVDVREMADDTLDVTEESSGSDQSPIVKSTGDPDDGIIEHPIVSFVMGTLTGNDAQSVDGRQKYGKILHPVTFASDQDTDVIAGEQVVPNGNGINGEQTIAGAFQVKLPNTKTSFNFTKEGVLEFSIDRSSAVHPLGAGRSANIGLTGSLKMSIGKQASDGKSLLLDLLGGAVINIGGESTKQRSLDMNLSNGLNFEIRGSDAYKNSIRARISNNIDMIIGGDRTTEIQGNEIVVVHGKLEHRVLGKKVDNYVNDLNQSFGGDLVKTIVQNHRMTIGQGSSTTITAPDLTSGSTVADSKDILLGSKTLDMLLGDNDVNMLAGIYTDNITLGERNISVGVGNFAVAVKVGDISMNTIVGNVDIGTTAGQMTLSALQITMKALTSVSINSPLVSIGSLPQGGVVNNGPLGHRDYMTGLLLVGSRTVTCNTG